MMNKIQDNKKRFFTAKSKRYVVYFFLAILLAFIFNIGFLKTAQASSSSNLFDIFKQIVSSFVNDTSLPDFESILDAIINAFNDRDNSNNGGQQTAQKLENKSVPTYEIQQDELEKAKTDSAYEVANKTTLDSAAQERLKETSQAVQSNLEANQQLGQESQELDASQQILQNLSQQVVLEAEQQATIIQQNQQAQVDRAINNIIAAQATEELAEANTSRRRQDAAAAATATTQWGLIRMAGLPAN